MRRLLPALLVVPALLLGLNPASAVETEEYNHRNVAVQDTFTLATFNVLGDSHTEPGGSKAAYADGPTRMRWAIRAMNRQGVQVVGFQEFQPRQKTVFLRRVGNLWDVWSGSKITDNSIAWRTDLFEFVRGETILIPYFHGTLRPMPIVLLRSKDTGQQMYFANFHNPANTSRPGDEEVWRDEATRKQIDMVHRLRNDGVAVFVTGDMNEREEYFCKFTANHEMHAANGGSNTDKCLPPQRPDRTRIDWIFGSTGTEFTDYRADESPLVQRTTDHPLVVARVR